MISILRAWGYVFHRHSPFILTKMLWRGRHFFHFIEKEIEDLGIWILECPKAHQLISGKKHDSKTSILKPLISPYPTMLLPPSDIFKTMYKILLDYALIRCIKWQKWESHIQLNLKQKQKNFLAFQWLEKKNTIFSSVTGSFHHHLQSWKENQSLRNFMALKDWI